MKKKAFSLISFFIILTSFSPAGGAVKEISLRQVQVALAQASQSHPRLFLNNQQLPGVMSQIQASDELKTLHEELLRKADALTKQKPVQRIQIGRRLLSVSREALKRLLTLSWAYRSCGDENYLKRAEQEMLAIADFSDWNPSHFLDVAEMTTAMAIGYDWLYNDLSDFPHVAIDMTEAYKGQLKKAVRGASLLPSGRILIQDELQATDRPATVRWAMVTPARVDIQSDKAAILSQKQKTMQFQVVTEADVKLTTYSTKPRSSFDADNGDTRMIGFEVTLAPDEKVAIAVFMTAGSQHIPAEMSLKKIQTWSKPLE